MIVFLPVQGADLDLVPLPDFIDFLLPLVNFEAD